MNIQSVSAPVAIETSGGFLKTGTDNRLPTLDLPSAEVQCPLQVSI